jgi:hypothetical protein
MARIEGTLFPCVSPELLQQCKKVADGVDEYLDGIAPRLQRYLVSTSHEYPNKGTFLEASHRPNLLQGPDDVVHEIMQEIAELVRIYTGANTARVRCASYQCHHARNLLSGTNIKLSNPNRWLAGYWRDRRYFAVLYYIPLRIGNCNRMQCSGSSP